MSEEQSRPKTAEIEDTISEEILRVHKESYGTGVHSMKTHLMEDLVVIIMDVELTPAERTLLDAGNEQAVKDTREAFQAAIGATFTAVVERATGRKVMSFVSHMNIEPLYAVELFRLDPPQRYATS
jgi:uncharacterized protein YbcI